MSLYKEKFQDIQEFRDQYMATRKVGDELGMNFARCKDDARAMLAKKGFTKPTNAQLRAVLNSYDFSQYSSRILHD